MSQVIHVKEYGEIKIPRSNYDLYVVRKKEEEYCFRRFCAFICICVLLSLLMYTILLFVIINYS